MTLKRNTRLLLLLSWITAAVAAAIMPAAAGADDRSRELARVARAILNQRCFQCHGMNGAARKNVFVLDRDRLVSSRVVVPGDPNSLLLRVIETGAMPLGGPELSRDEKHAIKDWMLDGAPNWEQDATISSRQFLTGPAIVALVHNDLFNARERARPYLRYFSLAHLYNAGTPSAELEVYRAALAKLINSLSWHREITPPVPIDPARTVFRIDLRDYNWTSATWSAILAAYPYGIRSQQSEIITAELDVVRADWFVASASVPPLYHDLLGLPKTVAELERLLAVDIARNLEEEKNVARAGVRNSGVSQNNRALERHSSPHGAYWRSYDFTSNLDHQNIFKDPLRLNPAGGEIIFNLPNGLQAYFLIDARGNRIDRAPVNIVADRNNPDDPIIQNGRSCISCHYEGMQSFKDDVRSVIRDSGSASLDREKVLALYPPQESLDVLIEKDRARFQSAVAQLGTGPARSPASEPINALSRKFATELTVAQAAAEAGLDVREFQERVRRSSRLVSLGFGQLLVANGGLKRDAWEKNFGELVGELRLGDYAPGGSALSRRTLITGLQTSQRNFNRATGRLALFNANPAEMLESARTIVIHSSTMFLNPAQLENELRKRPEFQQLELIIVRDAKLADIKIELGRPLFTYTFTFTVTNPETSILLTSGKVKAFDGNFAAPKIAKELLKRFQAARSSSALEQKK